MAKFAPILVVVALACSPAAPAPQADRSSPEAAVRSFWSAVTAVDLQSAAACVDGNPSASQLADLERDFKRKPLHFVVSDLRSAVSGDTARATFKLTAQAAAGAQPPVVEDSVDLRRDGTIWRITPAEIAAFKPGQGGVTLNVATGLAHPEILLAAHRRADEAACLANVDTINSGAVDYYLLEHGRFPRKAADFETAFWPYIKKLANRPAAELFHCPADEGAGESYSFNGRLQGLGFREFGRIKPEIAEKLVFVYEGRHGKLEFRHSGRACVCFLNGLPMMVDAKQARDLQWKP